MSGLIYKGHSALDFARQACNRMIDKFAPEDLPPKGEFYYHQGVFLSGMQKTYELCQDKKYYDYIKAWVDTKVRENGSIYHMDRSQLDYIQPGVLLYPLYHNTKEEKYKKALDTLIQILKEFPKNEEGGFWHNGGCQNQMWLDGLYMAGPICAQYSAEFGDTEYFDIPVFQALLMEKRTKDPTTGLWYHAWDCSRKAPWADPVTGLSKEFWGRSMGWVPVAVLEELEYLPKDHKDRKEMIRLTTDLLKALAKYQDPMTGLWYQVLDKGDKDGNWLESSCTCLYVAAIGKAVRCGYLDSSYLETARRGYQGIIDRLKYDEKGIIIDNICVGTGVGDYMHYINRPTSENDLHGVGAFLLMCTEVEKAF